MLAMTIRTRGRLALLAGSIVGFVPVPGVGVVVGGGIGLVVCVTVAVVGADELSRFSSPLTLRTSIE